MLAFRFCHRPGEVGDFAAEACSVLMKALAKELSASKMCRLMKFKVQNCGDREQ
jgi:hypothetical protein